jgi:hypothetical protein
MSRKIARLSAVAAACALAGTVPAAAQAFNPQPDPPGVVARSIYVLPPNPYHVLSVVGPVAP